MFALKMYYSLYILPIAIVRLFQILISLSVNAMPCFRFKSSYMYFMQGLVPVQTQCAGSMFHANATKQSCVQS